LNLLLAFDCAVSTLQKILRCNVYFFIWQS